MARSPESSEIDEGPTDYRIVENNGQHGVAVRQYGEDMDCQMGQNQREVGEVDGLGSARHVGWVRRRAAEKGWLGAFVESQGLGLSRAVVLGGLREAA